MVDLRRADLKTLWLLGKPVGHSLSPLIHNEALHAMGESVVYLAAPVEAEDFESAVRGLIALGAIGANVTVPHKEAAFRICDSVSPRAQAIGACNVLKFTGGQILGDNTDGAGWLRGLRTELPGGLPARAIVLGAGGSARAVVHALVSHQVGEVVVLNRSLDRAEALARHLSADNIEIRAASLEAFQDLIAGGPCLVVQTTSAGLDAQSSPIPLPHTWPEQWVLSELIYGRETPLMARVRELGGRVHDGLPMLIQQAAESLAIWLDRPLEGIPADLMLEVARRRLAG